MTLSLLPAVAYIAGWMCLAAITVQARLDRRYVGCHRGVGRSTRRRDRRIADGAEVSRWTRTAFNNMKAGYAHWAGSPAYVSLKTRVLQQQARVDATALRLRASVPRSPYGTPEMADVWEEAGGAA